MKCPFLYMMYHINQNKNRLDKMVLLLKCSFILLGKYLSHQMPNRWNLQNLLISCETWVLLELLKSMKTTHLLRLSTSALRLDVLRIFKHCNWLDIHCVTNYPSLQNHSDFYTGNASRWIIPINMPGTLLLSFACLLGVMRDDNQQPVSQWR